VSRAGSTATTIETVADAMVSSPKTWPAGTTVAEARAAFADDHVHMLLLVNDGVLLGTLVRDDLVGHVPPAAPALPMATLRDRTTRPDQPIEEVRQQLIATGHRRLAVVDGAGRLLGLLCLKRDLTGFCSDSGVAARADAAAG
jgi:CBS domain-containing protein